MLALPIIPCDKTPSTDQFHLDILYSLPGVVYTDFPDTKGSLTYLMK